MDISALYRFLNDHAGLTQRQIAACTGQNQSEVAEILSGRRRLVQNHRVLRRIVGGLDIPPEMMGLSWWGPDGTYYGPDGGYPGGVTVADTPEGVSAGMLRRHLLALGGVAMVGQPVKQLINDDAWNKDVFLPTVGKRGAAIIEARGLSSAASAANAAIDHMRDWALGTGAEWVTMGVPSGGEYGIPIEVMFGYPVTCAGGEYKIVEGLPIDAFSQERINLTLKELQEEQEGVKHLL